MFDSNLNNSLCLDPFWDLNLTWNTESPDFTQCFQQSMFVAVPCLFFWLAAAINIVFSHQTSHISLPWAFLNISKMVLAVMLVLVSVVKFVLEYYDKFVDEDIADIVVYATCIRIATFVLVIIVMVRNRSMGKTSSAVLIIFWFVLTICSCFRLRSIILNLLRSGLGPTSSYNFVCDLITVLLVICQLLLSLFTEKTSSHLLEPQNPYDSASFLSFITLFWARTLLVKGYKCLLTLQNFPPLPGKMRGNYVWIKFFPIWTKALTNKKYGNSMVTEQSTKTKLPPLMWTVIKTFWPCILYAHVLTAFSIFCTFIQPLILDHLITFTSSHEYAWKGYLFAVLLFLFDVSSRMFGNMSLLYSTFFGYQLRSTLFSAVYRKVLRLSSLTRRNYTTGEIVNISAVDIERIYMFFMVCTYLTFAPIRILVIMGLLWRYLGLASLSGLAILIILIGFNVIASRKIEKYQEYQMETKDKRLKFMAEILNGIKILKLYAWEIPFMKRLTEIREKEVHFLRAFQLLYGVTAFIWGSTGFSVAIVCFGTYVFINDQKSLDPNTLFVSLTLLTSLKYALIDMPQLSANLVQVIVSLKRVGQYLVSEERKENDVGNQPDEGMAISAKNATFSWSMTGESSIKNLNFHVAKGSLVTVIGPVGSGKSSLISAVLGDMYKLTGSLDIQGKVAYVPQQAWILNKTVKENILFLKKMHRTKYATVVKNCCLEPDFEILPAEDNTEIGEKGVNLSGGQKQRISLARAVYDNADVYLLDDPLSAVDAHVGKDLFDHVIGKNGLLKNKTRILVTHNISMLSESDMIITLKNGEIEEIGTYNVLMSRQGFFTELINEFSNIPDESTDNQDMNIKPTQNEVMRRSVSCLSLKSNLSLESKIADESMGRLIEDEEMEVGKVKRIQFITYAKHMHLLVLFLVAIGAVAYEVFEFGGNIWLSKWSSEPSLNNSTEGRNYALGVYAGIGFSQSISIVAASTLLAIGAARASKKFHFYLLEGIMKAPMSFFDTTPSGRILNRFGQDMDNIDTEIPQQIDGLLVHLSVAVGTVILIGCYVPIFLPFLVPISIACYVIQRFYLVTSRQLKRLGSVTLSPIFSHISESIQGAPSINAYKVSEEFIKTAEQKVDENCSCRFEWTSINRWLNFHLVLIGDFVLLVTCLLVVFSKDKLNPAVAGLLITYALSITENLVWLTRSTTEVETRVVSVERVTEYSKLQPEAPWTIEGKSPSTLWPLNGVIQFKDYCTRYRENLDLVLKDINLTINTNEKFGIVGRTGAGKSSFALALFRIIEPVSGTILIDGVDVCQIGLHELRSKLTVIPQDPTLFTGLLRMNLDPNNECSDDEIWHSLEHAGLKAHISSLQDGLSHEIAEGGGNLSVGQRQLVCLARALLKKSKIIVLDEATAAVDVETDQLIQATIRSEFKEHTVITIAHRLNTIIDYDRILVMDGGRVAELGSPKELLQNRNSNFYSMAKDAGIIT